MRTCKDCGTSIEHRAAQAKRCESCYMKNKLQKLAEKYASSDKSLRLISHVCITCGEEFRTHRSNSSVCKSCTAIRKGEGNHNYVLFYRSRLSFLHRALAVAILGEQVLVGKVVHHLDGNGTNNLLSNLIVLDRADHGSLHQYLYSAKFEDTVSLSLQWLNDNGCAYLILSEQFTGTQEELADKLALLKPKKRNKAIAAAVVRRLPVFKACKKCGTEFKPGYRTQKYCGYSCSRASCLAQPPPSAAQLAAMLKEYSLSEVARRCKVSHTSVNRWCVRFGIERKMRNGSVPQEQRD